MTTVWKFINCNKMFREFIDAKIRVKSTISWKLAFSHEIDESVFILIEKGYVKHSVEITFITQILREIKFEESNCSFFTKNEKSD